MPDEPKYLVNDPRPGRIYPSVSGYLQSIGHYAPPLAPGSLPAKIVAAKAAAAKAAAAKAAQEKTEEKKEEEKEVLLQAQSDVDYEFDALEPFVEVEWTTTSLTGSTTVQWTPDFLDVESEGSAEPTNSLDWTSSTEPGVSLEATSDTEPTVVLDSRTETDESLGQDRSTE